MGDIMSTRKVHDANGTKSAAIAKMLISSFCVSFSGFYSFLQPKGIFILERTLASFRV
jgi:hypothetical protein